MLKTILD